jgi:hypothetical protein
MVPKPTQLLVASMAIIGRIASRKNNASLWLFPETLNQS